MNPLLSKEGITESNPFNLQIYPDRSANPDEEGHPDISSAVFVTGSFGEVLLQYSGEPLTDITPEQFDLPGPDILVGGFQDQWHIIKPGIVHDSFKQAGAQCAFTQAVVPVDP